MSDNTVICSIFHWFFTLTLNYHQNENDIAVSGVIGVLRKYYDICRLLIQNFQK